MNNPRWLREAPKYGIPEYMAESLGAYAEDHCPVGGFLECVLSNDLRGACERADDNNKYLLFNYVNYIYNVLPAECWGSRMHYASWLEARHGT